MKLGAGTHHTGHDYLLVNTQMVFDGENDRIVRGDKCESVYCLQHLEDGEIREYKDTGPIFTIFAKTYHERPIFKNELHASIVALASRDKISRVTESRDVT